jgi:hypothetical protein
MHKWILGCIDGYSHWLLLNSCFQLIHWVLFDLSVGWNWDWTIRLWVARAGETRVWVVGKGVDWVSFGVIEAIVLESSLASWSIWGTVQALLLRKLHKFLRFDEMGALHTSDGWESPARSTNALVLNWGYCSCIIPIDGVLKVLSVKFNIVLSDSRLVPSKTSDPFHLSFGPIGELVVRQGVSLR